MTQRDDGGALRAFSRRRVVVDTRAIMRRVIAWVLVAVGVSRGAAADPVPVFGVGVGDRAPSGAEVERVALALGGDALHGARLREGLAPRFGRFAPREDVLAAPRAEVAQGWDAYFRSGPRAARRRLAEAVTAMEAAPDALALREDNRAQYLRAVGMLARIDLEARQTAEAEAWVRRALRLDAGWTPPPADFPPPVQQLVARIRAAPPQGEARITVRLPREGCSVLVDGAAQPGTAREQTVSVRAGTHRVVAQCSGPSRVREVSATGAEPAVVVIDPSLDARVQLSGDVAVVYSAAQDEGALLAGDAAALGRSLGARHAVAVGDGRVRVVDVETARVLGEVDPSRGDLADALRAVREGRTHAPVITAPPPPVRAVTARGAGAGPWVLVATGGALVAAGAVLWVLREGAYDDLAQRCPFVDGVPACPDAASLEAARDPRDRANLYQGLAVGAWATGGVALASGLLWYALGQRREERVAVHVSPRGASLSLRW